MFGIRRRDFITLLGGAAAWPIAAHGQQSAMPVVGWLDVGSPASFLYMDGFRKGLKATGYFEGVNLTIEYRWAENQLDRLPDLVADLVRRRVAAIVATPTNAALAAKVATATIPIIFQTGIDPFAAGLVASFNRPGGNLTGVYQFELDITKRRLQLLYQLVPDVTIIATLSYPQSALNADQLGGWRQAARALGLRVIDSRVIGDADLEPAFASLASRGAGALFINASSFFVNHRAQLIALAKRFKLPAIYQSRDFVDDGGLLSYATNFSAVYEQIGIYTGRILKGEKASDLPVVRPTKFELVINLKTAKALGLTVPPTLLAIADEVIE